MNPKGRRLTILEKIGYGLAPAAVGALLLVSPALAQTGQDAAAGSPVIRHFAIAAGGEYCAWPSLARSGKDLIVLFTRTEEHLAPNGAILLSRSTDGGSTWLSPVVVLDSPIDDRESGITTLGNGWLLAHFWSTCHTREFYESLPPTAYRPEVIARWVEFVERPEYRGACVRHGAWQSLSTDGGRTWTPLVRGHDSVHGGIELEDGSILLASYREAEGGVDVFRAVSVDSPWVRCARVSAPEGGGVRFAEPHVVRMRGGRIVMMIRAGVTPYSDQDPRTVLWETYSDDGGRSWVAPFQTPLWGYPPHLTLLSDGRLLCTYGYRRPPYGERACVSEDGITWRMRDEVVLSGDAPNHDLGYPASLEVEKGVILTVYYQPEVPAGTVQQLSPPDPLRTKPSIRGTLWRVPPGR